MLDSTHAPTIERMPIAGIYDVYRPLMQTDGVSHNQMIDALSYHVGDLTGNGVELPIEGFKLTLLPGDVVQDAFAESSARNASEQDINRVLTQARSISHVNGKSGVALRPETFKMANQDGTESLLWACEFELYVEERQLMIDGLRDTLGVFIDEHRLPRNPSIEVVRMNPAAIGERAYESQVKPRVLGTARAIRPDTVTTGPVVAFGRSSDYLRS